MTDKELLTLAAKAAGYDISHKWNAERLASNPPVISLVIRDKRTLEGLSTAWNPLTDDGDALRLAVKLDMNIEVWSPYQEVWVVADGFDVIEEPWGEDKLAATRRAIVRAAAEIGRGME